jgi:ribosomal protein S18 acetylase RimI-like enzyme
MNFVQLRPMSPHEFDEWREWAVEDYAREDVIHKRIDSDRARGSMSAFMESALPQGSLTEGHRLAIVEDAASGQRVGYTWWAERELTAGRTAWIYDVYIDEPYRGRGFGRALMGAVEAQVREAGLVRIELHVWVDNHPATSLYRSLGFTPTGMEMFKELS